MRRRLLLSSLGVVIVAILVLGVPLLLVTVRFVGNSARNELLREADYVSTYVEDRATERLDTDRLRVLVRADDQVSVTNAKGTISAGPALLDQTYTVTQALSDGGEVRVTRRASVVHARQAKVAALVGGLVLISVVVAASASVFLARRFTRPLLDVAARAARLGAGDFRPWSVRYDIPELDRVSDVLDRSARQIADLLRRERDFASDVSHQLRTRLTALRIRLEEIALSADSETQEDASAALEQVERLNQVIDELLAQARRKRAENAVEVDVGQEVRVAVDERAPTIDRLGREVVVEAATGLRTTATPGRLQQAVGVLVDNAIEHGSGKVRVATRATGQHVLVEVTDEGPGVAPELVPTLFQRGVSGDGGTGLGLAVARALIEADGGRLDLRAACPPVFGIFLPRVDAPDNA